MEFCCEVWFFLRLFSARGAFNATGSLVADGSDVLLKNPFPLGREESQERSSGAGGQEDLAMS